MQCEVEVKVNGCVTKFGGGTACVGLESAATGMKLLRVRVLGFEG